jgi:hypothetical protein
MQPPPIQIFWRGTRIHHLATATQKRAIGFAQNRATSCRQHLMRHSERTAWQNQLINKRRRVGTHHIVQHRLLDITKSSLPFTLKKFPNRATQPLLNPLARINKMGRQPARKLPTHRRFTRTGETDKGNQANRLNRVCTSRCCTVW